MTDKQPKALELADTLDAAGLPRCGAILRTQHAAIERKDALLRRALKALVQSTTHVPYEGFGMAHREAERQHSAAIDAITKELSQ